MEIETRLITLPSGDIIIPDEATISDVIRHLLKELGDDIDSNKLELIGIILAA